MPRADQTADEKVPMALDEEVLRAALYGTWHAFFARFGRLTGIQRRAVKPILAGRHVLLNAPTASGKTEAAIAPLIERHLSGEAAPRGIPGVRLLVVAPTRALCNDLYRRLLGPIGRCRLTLATKTADFAQFRDDEPPHVLVTTPESMDSLLARRAEHLRLVRAVLLDELHLLADTARGDQLAGLLARLDRVTGTPVQRCAASATVPYALALAHRFLGHAAVVASDPDAPQRAIEATLAPALSLDQAAQCISAQAGEPQRRKQLVFANTREQVEQLSALLSHDAQLQGRVFAHHGSLARDERLRVERAFLDAPSAICVATMTLELGIDIGDVDGTVLVSPPADVSSLLQRVGRGNRSESTTRVLCLHQSPFERERFLHLLDCAARGVLFAEMLAPRPSVLAQQAVSMLFQNPQRWVVARAVHERMSEDARGLWSEKDCAEVLDTLARAGKLRRLEHGRFTAEPALVQAFEYGRIHSMIVDRPEVEVIDELTGRAVGTVRFGARDRDRLGAGETVVLSLGGRAQTVLRVRDQQIYVHGDAGRHQAQFIAREAPRYSWGLARDLARHLGYEADTMGALPLADGRWQLAHYQGSVRAVLLGWALEALGYDVSDVGPFFATLDQPPANGAPLASPDALRNLVEGALSTRFKQLERKLQPGAMVEHVPDALRLRWVKACVDTADVVNALARMVVVHRGPGEENQP